MAQLLSRVTYIEYNARGGDVRISLDNPIQMNSRAIFDFIRTGVVCGDGGNGETDLIGGLDTKVDEYF